MKFLEGLKGLFSFTQPKMPEPNFLAEYEDDGTIFQDVFRITDSDVEDATVPRYDAEDINFGYNAFVEEASFYHSHHTRRIREWTYISGGVAFEGGEAGDVIKKLNRDPNISNDAVLRTHEKFKDLAYELGDIHWYMERMYSLLRVTPEELKIMNTVKLYERLIENGQEEYAIWPYKNLSYADALKLTQHIEKRITGM